MRQLLLALLTAVTGGLACCPTALAQINSISVESFPLEIDSPYKTFTTPQPAVVTIQTSITLTITVSPPVPDGFTDPAGTVVDSYARYNGVEDTNGVLNINDIGTVEVDVGMSVTRPDPYPAGTYNYDVTLTLTAQ
jgi:hypothetical protein